MKIEDKYLCEYSRVQRDLDSDCSSTTINGHKVGIRSKLIRIPAFITGRERTLACEYMADQLYSLMHDRIETITPWKDSKERAEYVSRKYKEAFGV